MYSRRLFRLAVAGATIAVGIAPATPAAAAVTYDPETETGFVGGSDVQRAFGWSDATLAARAAGIVFKHEMWTTDTYAVSCGAGTFPLVHARTFGWFQLTRSVAHRGGYHRRPVGFRLTGPFLGISGTTVPPMAGQPCPDLPGATMITVDPVSSVTGWALTANSGDDRRRLKEQVTPGPLPGA